LSRASSIVAVLAVLAAPAAAAAENEISLGAGVGIFAFSDGRSYEGRATRFLSNLGAGTGDSRHADWAIVPVLTQSWRFHRYLAVELTERYWESAAKGVSAASPDMSYRLAKSVWPITLALKAVGTNEDMDAGVTASAGPGMYIVATDERGWFGKGGGTGARLGVHLTGGFFVRLGDSWFVRGDLAWDWFTLDTQNRLMNDGGNGGGLTVTGGIEYRL
jgi:hypothetical protein